MTATPEPRDLRVLPDPAAVAEAAARELFAAAHHAVRERGTFTLALSGGSTPKRLYSLLAQQDRPFFAEFPWAKTEVYFGDERFVLPDHADSNYRMAHEALLAHVPVPPASIHRVRTELATPEASAHDYEGRLPRPAFAAHPPIPALDLVLLGMGKDAHTASLFPDTTALAETTRLVVANFVPKLDAHRVTFTLPLINHAQAVLFLVTGADKAAPLSCVLAGPSPSLPASLVQPVSGRLTWLVDAAAAKAL
ncbi:MAG: 6-phosphogluconolactonase [Deltaproteobacteria bacterium]|nr:6-phosphogluconolactonase [Deltaproteobacteria bacterium]